MRICRLVLLGAPLIAAAACSYEPAQLSYPDAQRERDGAVSAAGEAGLPPAPIDPAPAGPEGDARSGVDLAVAVDASPVDAGSGAPAADAPLAADAATVGPDASLEARPLPPPPDTAPPPPACMAVAEVCDGRDNDCDSTVDEGFRISSNRSTYTVLQRHNAGCTAVTRFGPACNQAAHRFCVARGCTNSGFAPIENSGDIAVVACVAGATLRNVSAAVLTAHQVACVGAAHSLGCNSAIHRYCRDLGFTSGYGPVEGNTTSALVACVGGTHVSVVSTTYSALRGLHPGCTGDTERLGITCNAAIDRFCIARGAVTGFGPVENSGDTATVVCLVP
jgi:hypothetical protein